MPVIWFLDWRQNKLRATTMHIKNSDFTGYSGGVAHIGLRQICDLTNLKGCKFGSLSYRSEIALYFATFSYAHHYRQANKMRKYGD